MRQFISIIILISLHSILLAHPHEKGIKWIESFIEAAEKSPDDFYFHASNQIRYLLYKSGAPRYIWENNDNPHQLDPFLYALNDHADSKLLIPELLDGLEKEVGAHNLNEILHALADPNAALQRKITTLGDALIKVLGPEKLQAIIIADGHMPHSKTTPAYTQQPIDSQTLHSQKTPPHGPQHSNPQDEIASYEPEPLDELLKFLSRQTGVYFDCNWWPNKPHCHLRSHTRLW